MPFHDIRDHIEFLRAENELETIHGAELEYEIGGITEIAIHETRARKDHAVPALLFDDIPGHEPGYRILTNTLTTPFRWMAAAGIEEPKRSKQAAILARKDLRKRDTDFIPPEYVKSGPVFENIMRDEAVDIGQFPAPVWHEKDGGPFIGTGDMVITNHADTAEINAGTYRVQVQGPNQLTVYPIVGRDAYIHRKSYLEQGEPCPMVVDVGPPIDLVMVANENLPHGANELAFGGGRRGEPVEVVEGEVTGLPIPTTSELVLEGHIYPDSEPLPEGPFGEWTGYYGHTNQVQPLTVERIYYRDDPIILGLPTIRPPRHIRSEIKRAASMWTDLEKIGIPGIKAVNSLSFATGFFEAVSVDTQYDGHSVQVGMQITTGRAAFNTGRFVIVVDEDIDVYNHDELLWAMASRCDPARDIHVVENCRSSTLDPIIHPDQKDEGNLSNTRVIVDATRPYHWRHEFPAVNETSKEYKAELYEKWGDQLQLIDDSAM